MDFGCMARCISLAVFAASLQAFAQPPEGKGKPAQAGPSPFIHFPVPQQSVGVVRHSQSVAAPHAKAPELAGKAFDNVGKGASAAVVGGGNALGKSANHAPVPGGNAFGKSANHALVPGGNAFGKSMAAAPVLTAAPVVSAAPSLTAAPTVAPTPAATAMVPGGIELKAVNLAQPSGSAASADASSGDSRAPLPECGGR